MAALNRTEQDLIEIKEAFLSHERKLQMNESSVEEDLMFHLKIAKASKNTVLKSLMTIITPDIVKNFNKYRVCDDNNFQKTRDEHKQIIKMIEDQNPEGAVEAMQNHLNDIRQFSLHKIN